MDYRQQAEAEIQTGRAARQILERHKAFGAVVSWDTAYALRALELERAALRAALAAIVSHEATAVRFAGKDGAYHECAYCECGTCANDCPIQAGRALLGGEA